MLVQASDGVAQAVGGEELGPPAPPLRVDLDQNDLLSLEGADIELPTGEPARRQGLATQPERIAEGCERLVATRRGFGAQQGAPCGEGSRPVVVTAGAVMVHDLHPIGEQGGESVGVVGSDRGIEASHLRGRGVRAHAAPQRRRRTGPQRVEAGDRLGLAVDVEVIEARQQAIASEDPELEELPLEGAAASAVGAEERPPQEERVRLQTEDFVLSHGGVVDEKEPRTDVLERLFRPTRGPGPQGPVVDDLDAGCERRGVAIGVPRSQIGRGRTRRSRGAVACGAVGQELGVALVQPRNGIAQSIGGEELAAPASPLRVDLGQGDFFQLHGTDVEVAAGERAERHDPAAQSERVAEGRELFVLDSQVLGPEQRAPGVERSAPVVAQAARMVECLRIVGEQAGERVGVSRSHGRVQSGGVGGRGVRSHAAPHGRRRLGRQLVEARERLGLALGVEPLDPLQEAIRSGDPEDEEGSFVGPAAGTGSAKVSPAQEQRIRLQAEDLVVAQGGVLGELERGAVVLQQRLPPVRGPGPQDPVVDDLDAGCERRCVAIDIERAQIGRDRARCRRRVGALGAVEEKLGVALVQAGDGVAQPVGGEDLGPPASPVRVDLDQKDVLGLVGADIELLAGQPAR